MARAATKQAKATTEWGRGRLLAILVTAAVVAVILLGTLIYALVAALVGVGHHSDAARIATGQPGQHAARAQGPSHRDKVAAAPMLKVPRDAMYPADAATGKARAISIPAGTVPGPAMVMTGFPETPQGAIGQLAQIDVEALQTMSLRNTEQTYLSWALPGGVGPRRWRITASVADFLSAAGMGEEKEPGSQISIQPAAALVKGTDGPDWTLACVLFKVTASYRQTSQVAFADCERMQWVGGRWMLAPGAAPAPPPNTWPGTAAANQAGWRTWTTSSEGTS